MGMGQPQRKAHTRKSMGRPAARMRACEGLHTHAGYRMQPQSHTNLQGDEGAEVRLPRAQLLEQLGGELRPPLAAAARAAWRSCGSSWLSAGTQGARALLCGCPLRQLGWPCAERLLCAFAWLPTEAAGMAMC